MRKPYRSTSKPRQVRATINTLSSAMYYGAGSACDVGVEPFGKFAWAAEGDAVPGIDLVGVYAEPLADDPAEEVGREQPVVAAEQEACRHVRPRRERPRRFARRVGLGACSAKRLVGELDRDIVVEGLACVTGPPAADRLVAAVRPPFARCLTRFGDKAGDEDEELDGDACADERRREGAGRLRNDGQLAAVADSLGDRVGVVPKACRIVVAGEIGRDHVVAALA